jgi:hypothetical protein
MLLSEWGRDDRLHTQLARTLHIWFVVVEENDLVWFHVEVVANLLQLLIFQG